MAFPQVETTATSEETSDTTSHTVSLPANIASGDLLVVFFGVEHSSDSTVAWPGGWTELDESFLTNIEGAAAYRIATGSEGSTITVTSGQSKKSGHIAYRISGTSGNAPEIESFTSDTGGSRSVPVNTPSWGAQDTLWLAAFAASNTKHDGNFSSYGNLVEILWGTAGEMVVGDRELNNTVSTDGFYTITPGDIAVVDWTLAVEPAPPPPLVLSRVSSMHFQRHYEPTAIGQ